MNGLGTDDVICHMAASHMTTNIETMIATIVRIFM